MGTETVVVLVALVVAAAAWAFMFVPSRRGIWPRTWVAAGLLSATSLACLAAVGRLGEILGPVDVTELAIGLAVGAAWLVATHVGYRVITWLVPSFGAQVRDLYRLRDGDASPSQMAGPIIAMGFAEELLFRGVLQGVGGFAVGLAAYTAVQAFERKWALALAALLGGAVWGALFAWRFGLVAPIAAHVLWTGVLTFLWPLGDEEPVTPARAGSYASG
ncbi:MAG: type II CAAX prenyl endopeptidase Rce1 family protein [Acidimicrobiia bacterium]